MRRRAMIFTATANTAMMAQVLLTSLILLDGGDQGGSSLAHGLSGGQSLCKISGQAQGGQLAVQLCPGL